MKNVFLLLAVMLSCLGLSACGPNKQTYLNENVATWNSVNSELTNVHTRFEAVEEAKDFSNLAFTVGNMVKSSEERLAYQKSLYDLKAVPENAKPLQSTTIAYFEKSVVTFKAMQELTSIAATGSESEIDSQYEKAISLYNELGAMGDTWSQAQDSYAKDNGISLVTVN